MPDCEEIRLVIPTYERGPDSPFVPLTLAGLRGGRRPPYPYHMQDDIDVSSMQRDDTREYRAIRLSNGLLEAIVLPDMNGRLYSLRSCRTGRELFYRNHVVKPALVALRGAWISGGIEFNFPTVGHSVSTVSPVFCTPFREENAVGVTIGDIDRSTRQRWQVSMRLRKGRAALDIETTLTNPGDTRERLYYWENAAVPATDDLRFICRCDWTVGRESQPFPVRDGIDRSFHLNNARPLDHFGYRSHADYFGAYYANDRTGTYHFAPRVSLPGQKYFTWGTGEDQRIWQRYLTDQDGQYVEIQAGLLETQWVTDWLQPKETVHAQGCWFGTDRMGEVRWASEQLAVGTSVDGDSLILDLYSIDLSGQFTIVLDRDGEQQSQTVALEPDRTVHAAFDGISPCTFQIDGTCGGTVLRAHWYGPLHKQSNPAGDRSKPRQWAMNSRAQEPAGKLDVAIQYHRWIEAERIIHTIPREEYTERIWLQAMDVQLKTGNHEDALALAREALQQYPHCEQLHALGAAAAWRLYRAEGKAEHRGALQDHALAARRNAALLPAMVNILASADMLDGEWNAAARLLEPLAAEATAVIDHRVLLAACKRHAGNPAAGGDLRSEVPTAFAFMLILERWLNGIEESLAGLPLPGLLPARPWTGHYRVELLLEAICLYWRTGMMDDVVRLIQGLGDAYPLLLDHPLSHLLLMDAAMAAGKHEKARQEGLRAAACPTDWIVPFRWETGILLQKATALGIGQRGSLAFLSGIGQLEAGRFETGVCDLENAYAVEAPSQKALTAVVLADYAEVVSKDPDMTTLWLRRALQHTSHDRRLMLRLDTLLRNRHDLGERQRLWQQIDADLRRRGDVSFALARLELDSGNALDALDLLSSREFSVYEADASVRRLYVDACLIGAMEAFLQNQYDQAETLCRRIFDFPLNLGAASYLGEHSRLSRYLLGLVAHAQRQHDEAEQWWQDVLQRGGESVTYTVGGEDGGRIGRVDEQLALILAKQMLDAHHEARMPLKKPPRQNAELSPEQLADLVAVDPEAAVSRTESAVKNAPCNALLQILWRLAEVQVRALSTRPSTAR